MQVFRLNPENAEAVGRLMTDIRPVWWPDFQDAYGQLTDIGESIETVGWLLGEDEAHPKGWALCRELKCYSAIELECCGLTTTVYLSWNTSWERFSTSLQTMAAPKGTPSFAPV